MAEKVQIWGGKSPAGEKESALPQELRLLNRRSLALTGVRRVIRCESEGATIETTEGILSLTGRELCVEALNLEEGTARVAGLFSGFVFTDARTPSGILRRIFR